MVDTWISKGDMYVFIVDRGDSCGKLPFIFTVITLIAFAEAAAENAG